MSDKSTCKLEVNEDIDFERRDWRAQGIGWGLMLGLLAAALAGLFGSGPLSSTSVGSEADGFRIGHERFGRLESPMALHVQIRAGAESSNEARLWFSQQFLNGISIESLTPEPSEIEAEGQGWSYVFPLRAPANHLDIQVHYRAERWGRINGLVGLEPSKALLLRQWIYP